jgi:uracil-DNA glycosylase family 4
MSRAPLSLLPKCGLCGLHKKCHSPKMPVYGQGQRKILVVGEGPGETEDRRGRPFVPEAPAGGELYAALRDLGVDPDRDCWLTNALICKSPPDPEPQLIDHCRANTANAVRTLKPEKIILLGGPAVRSVLGWLWKEDPGGVSRWAGFRCPAVEDGDGNVLNAWVCPTFHPSFILRHKEPDLARLFFRRHLKEALEAPGRPFREVPDYAAGVECLRNDAQAARRLEEFAARDGAVAFDFETDRLKPEGGGRILSASVSDDAGTTAFMWGPRSARAFRELMLSGRPKICHNQKYEIRWCRRVLGVTPRNLAWDSMVQAHLIDNRSNACALKFLAFALLGAPSYDLDMKRLMEATRPDGSNRLDEAPPDKLLLYGGLDARFTLLVARRQAEYYGETL